MWTFCSDYFVDEALMERKSREVSRKSKAVRTLGVRLVATVNEGNAGLDEVSDRLNNVLVNISLHVCYDVSAKGHTGG